MAAVNRDVTASGIVAPNASISFFCSHLTRYRSRRSGLSVIGIVMPIVGSSAPGYIHRSRILDPKEPVQRFLARKPPVSFPPSSPLPPVLASGTSASFLDSRCRYQGAIADTADILDDALRLSVATLRIVEFPSRW